jgi:septal ring factor EnvC (AmiA/AmiB activator)
MTPTPTLTADLDGLAARMVALAQLCPEHLGKLANSIACQAAAAALYAQRAERLERELAAARRTIAELHAQAAEEADAAEAAARAADPTRAERWHRHARIIAAIVPPGPAHGADA